ncbi:MAG: 4Fe-4S binding protein [Gammaproteobacteria bacterium]|nr:4Fe-4S binding protein [Pseudomonadales bacterium]
MMTRQSASVLLIPSLVVFLCGFVSPVSAQPGEAVVPPTPFSTDVQSEWLYEVLPSADEFEEKQGDPPAWPGYHTNPETLERTLAGYVFLSADVPPVEGGYSAPIDTLIGVDPEYRLTGLKILDYNETYRRTKGDFLADYGLLSQFRGKPIRDDFQISRDIDGLSGSTVSVFAIARGARNAARRIAETYLGYDPTDPVQEAREARISDALSQYSWEQMLDNGIVRQLEVPLPDRRNLVFSFTYLGHPGLGAFWIGDAAYALAERAASAYLAGDEMVLVAVGGSAAAEFRPEQLQFFQDNDRFLSWFRRLTPESYVPVGNADAGMIEGHGDFAGAIILPDSVDITSPITLGYRHLGTSDRRTVEFQPVGLGLRLAQGEDVLSEEEIAAILRAENSWLRRFLKQPPWGVTPWGKVVALALVLSLATAAFLRKQARWRWAALAVTVAYLGYIDGGFLSISQVINTINQGPDFLLSNLPLLLFVIFTAVTTLIWGRVFCSALCPFGAVQEFITRFTPKHWRHQVSQSIHDKALYLKYLILALIIGTTLAASNVAIFQYFEPFGTFFFLKGALVLWVILFATLAACFIVPRFYCRYLCPLGALLGVVSLVSPLRIRRVPQCTVCIVCERSCPTGAIRREKIDFKECVRCDICEIKLIDQAGACGHDMTRIIASSK